MRRQSFIAGVATGVLVAILVAATALGMRVWTRPLEQSGGGKHLNSPDAHYKAEAWNMRQRNLSGGMRNYYSFVVIDNNSGLEICRYEIPMPDDGVRFREGSGGIDWDEQSSVVRFGTQDNTVWTYAIRPPKS